MPDQANAQCVGTDCANGRDICRYVGTPGKWCETIGLGAGDDVPPGGGGEGLAEAKQPSLMPHAKFIQCFQIIETNERLQAAGIEVGDIITHVDRYYPSGMQEFSDLMKKARHAAELHVLKANGLRCFITLAELPDVTSCTNTSKSLL